MGDTFPTPDEMRSARRTALANLVALDVVTVPAEALRETLREASGFAMQADRLRRKAEAQAEEITRLRALLERYRGIAVVIASDGEQDPRVSIRVAGAAVVECYPDGRMDLLPYGDDVTPVRAWVRDAIPRLGEKPAPEKPVDTPAPTA